MVNELPRTYLPHLYEGYLSSHLLKSNLVKPNFDISWSLSLFSNMTTLPLLVSVSIFVFVLAYILHQRLRFKLPPGPRPWPVVGNLYAIKPLKFRCFAEWAQAYGPIVSVWYGSALNVVVCDAELAKQVLRENDQQLADRHRTRLSARFSRDGKDLIWADYGPHYVKVRKVSTLELFSAKRLEELRPIREDEVTFMVESIFKDCTNPENHGKSLLVKKYLGDVAFNNITRLAFGKRFMNSEGIIDEQGQEFKAIVSNGLRLGASLTISEHIPWLQWMFPLEEEAVEKHNARRDGLTRVIMEEHTNARKKSGGAKKHFVDALLTLQEKYDLSEVTIIGLLWLGINLVTSMIGHLLHHFHWTTPDGVDPEEIDMSERPGVVTYMMTPLQAEATPRLPPHLHKRMASDM
ncbi:hypothetical protein OIU84_026582 [Salix udensis]|uniref:Cytochrome P450 n=1 Tax=Salix udensis TaxID=889485 RepID=A0AAD6PEW0_9ROSI|nr:hypothetical protein OIU84_026582 [Salix udensis]